MTSEESNATKLGRRTDEWLGEYGDVLGVVPYADQVVAAYRIVRSRRVRHFLHGLVGATGEFSDAQQSRFRTYIDSPTGRELLADFADSSLRTRTRTATAALAVLYADFEHARFSPDFKSLAVVALEGLTDRWIDAFLLLGKHRERLFKTPDEGPYAVLGLRAAVLAENPELADGPRRVAPG